MACSFPSLAKVTVNDTVPKMKQIVILCVLLAIISFVQCMEELYKKQWRNNVTELAIKIRTGIKEMNQIASPLCSEVKAHIVFVAEKEVLFGFDLCDKPESSYPVDDCYFAYDKYFRVKVNDIKNSDVCEQDLCEFWKYEVLQGPKVSSECFYFRTLKTAIDVNLRCTFMNYVSNATHFVEKTIDTEDDCTVKEMKTIYHENRMAMEKYDRCKFSTLDNMDIVKKPEGECWPVENVKHPEMASCFEQPLQHFLRKIENSTRIIEECTKLKKNQMLSS